MNILQQTILHAAHENGGTLPAPQHSLSLNDAQSYCGLHNIRAVDLNQDYSLTLTDEGRRILRNLS